MMKLTLFLSVCFVFTSYAVTFSQQKVNMRLGKTTIKEALTEFQRVTNMVVIYSDDNFETTREVVANFKNVELNVFLTTLLKGSGMTYKLMEDYILILQSKITVADSLNELKKHVVRGVVKDEKGEVMPGVTVLIKGTKVGVATDVDGKFELTTTDLSNLVLEFSFIGMKTVAKKVPQNVTDIVVYMSPDVEEIDEVVVTGVVTRKAESFTGSALTVKGDDLRRVGNQNVFASLKNLDPTLYVMDNLSMGSDPNTLPDMMMRGRTAMDEMSSVENLKGNYLNKPNQPLFILDGFEVSAERIFDMDMNLVESLTILKDAAAKALYGSKAANGVVVIETKKLDVTKPRVTYTGSLDLNMPDLSSYNLCNADEKLTLEFESGVFDDHSYEDITRYSELRKKVSEGLDTYWLSKPVRFGYGHKHSVYLEMGKEELRASLNFAYSENKGVMKGSDRRNISGVINVAYNLRNKLRFQNDFSLNSNRATDSPYGSFYQYVVLNPYEDPYEKDGTLKQRLSNGDPNPLNDGLSNTKLQSRYVSFSNNLNIEWTVLKGLRLRGRFGITHKNNDADRFYPRTHSRFAQVSDVKKKGSYEVNNGEENVLSGDVSLNYAKSFREAHNIFFNASYSISEQKSREVIHYTTGFPSDRMEDIMFALTYSESAKPRGIARTSRDLGVLGIFSYSYKDRYLLDATYRANASSMFGSANRWGSFWSIGLGWNLHKETFAQNWTWLERFKVRGSIGLTGNQNFASNSSIAIYSYKLDRFYNDMVGSTLQNMENPNLKWERKKDYNLGLDAELYGISLRVDWYKSLSEDRVSSMVISPSTGFGSVSTNLGSVRNNGVEVYLAYTVWQSKNGFVRFNGSISHNKNKLLILSEDLKGLDNNYVEGEDLSAIQAVYSYGVDPATGIEMFRKLDGSRTFKLSTADRIVVGVGDPKYRGILGFNGEYKGFGLSCNCRFLGGCQMLNRTLIDKVDAADIKYNVDRRVLKESWMVAGDHTHFVRRIPKMPYNLYFEEYIPEEESTMGAPSYIEGSSRFVQDRREFDISSISVYYDMNHGWIRKLGMERMRFTVYMNDIYKWSSMGVERGTSYPFANTVSFQLSMTF